jgi:N-acetylornithine carbamoyltransferase
MANIAKPVATSDPGARSGRLNLDADRSGRGAAIRHFISTQDWTLEELHALLDQAAGLKANPVRPLLQGRTLALLFLNRSLRTRASFQIGAAQLGATAIILEPGNGVWGIEFDTGKIMDGKAEEHIVEVAGVLSRYCDLIAMRAFPGFKNWQYDREDPLIKALARYSKVPVINMETIIHPCQELALAMTLQERLGPLKGKKLCLTWTWNPHPLSTAVANSVAMIATKYGMKVSLLCPSPEYVLDERFMKAAQENARASGGRLWVTHEISDGYEGADVVYANSWGALPYYGDPEREWNLSRSYGRFIVDEGKMAMTNNAIFSHCLPVRRNVEATDGVLDGPSCVAIDEAENRLHVQKALMLRLLGVAPG